MTNESFGRHGQSGPRDDLGSASELDDRTIVVGDETIAVAHVHDETVAVSDETIVTPIERPRRKERREHREHGERSEHRSELSSPLASSITAPPIADPAKKRSLRQVIGVGLDPKRPISSPPGIPPWAEQPVGERGVSQMLPVSYAARSQSEMPLQTGVDEVQRRLGTAPPAIPVQVSPGREGLPSLQRRDRERGLATLTIYAAVVVSSLIGLLGLASYAFGW